MAIDFPMFAGPSFCSSAWSAASGAQEKWEDVAWEGHKKHLTIWVKPGIVIGVWDIIGYHGTK
jgi:hypothetical protein